MPENDRKAWVRYPPPRWIYEGPAICAVPRETSIAFLRAFHAHCGVSLENPRLGFVCSKVTTDGQPGLEGYFLEGDRDLAPDQRLRFAPGESAPPFDPLAAPRLDWSEERLIKARRNYAVQYIRMALPVLCELLGHATAARLGREAAILVGMQLYDETAALLGIEGRDAGAFGAYLAAMLCGGGDGAECVMQGEDVLIRTQGSHVLSKGHSTPELFDAWNGLWHGALAVHDRHSTLTVEARMDRGDDEWRWRVG